ncbi:hypothetical protein DH2020_025130 [Rehmannia glutinosa]|uniref:Uncharacterized protein n=1 Tax=Rehmannia glutinosa TaxID=99300 RepID=A0ABR0W300_REHGL
MGGATAVSDHSSKPKKPKSREVSSRFLSPTSSSTTSSSTEYGNQSPNSTLISSPKQKPKSSTDRSRKHKSYENSGFFRGLWPSSSIPSPSSNSKLDTLANHLGHDRLKDLEERKNNKLKSDQNSISLNRQKSCTEFSRFENEKKIYASAKENQKPVFGGSMRYTGKFKFAGKSPDDNNDIVPGRFSVDENTLRKKSFSRGGLLLSDADDTRDSESEYSDVYSGGTSFDTPAAGKDFPASRRWSAGLNQKPVPSDNNSNSPKIFTLKNAMKKAAHGNWALSPGRSVSPKMNSKPPTSPSRGKGVGNILSMGIELLKGKKSSSSVSSPLGPGSAENVHQLRLLHNRLMQWRYSNARAEAVNGNVIKQAEVYMCFDYLYFNDCDLLFQIFHLIVTCIKVTYYRVFNCTVDYYEMKSLSESEDLIRYLKMNKALENWGNMERQHLSGVCTTIDYLHSVVCRVPLVDGAKVESQSASIAVRHASDLAASIHLMLTTFSLTIEERSLRSSIMQLKLLQQHHHQQQYILA